MKNKEKQKLICNTYLELKDMSAVAKKLNVSVVYVSDVLEKYNIRQKLKNRYVFPIVEKIIYNDYLETNLSEDELAAKHNVSVSTIRNIWKRNGTGKSRERLVKCDDSYFKEINSPEKSWLLGFIAGDGSITSGYTLSIALSNKDITLLQKIAKFLNSEHVICDDNHSVSGVMTNIKRFSVSRKEIYNDLIKWGITPEKSNKLSIPKIDDYLIPHFIRGLVCSDGSFAIDSDNTLNFSIVCPIYSFLEEIQNHLINNCQLKETQIVANRKINPSCYYLRQSGNFQVRKIFEYLYPDNMGDAYLERKYNYCKQHFYNLDKGIKSRNKKDPPPDQYSFTTDLRYLSIVKSSDMTHRYYKYQKPEPQPRSQLDILLGINK